MSEVSDHVIDRRPWLSQGCVCGVWNEEEETGGQDGRIQSNHRRGGSPCSHQQVPPPFGTPILTPSSFHHPSPAGFLFRQACVYRNAPPPPQSNPSSFKVNHLLELSMVHPFVQQGSTEHQRCARKPSKCEGPNPCPDLTDELEETEKKQTDKWTPVLRGTMEHAIEKGEQQVVAESDGEREDFPEEKAMEWRPQGRDEGTRTDTREGHLARCVQEAARRLRTCSSDQS